MSQASVSTPCHGSKMSDIHNKRKELLEELERAKKRQIELENGAHNDNDEATYLEFYIEDLDRRLKKMEQKNSDINLENTHKNVTYVSRHWRDIYDEEIEPYYQEYQQSLALSRRNEAKLGEHVKTQIDALKVNKKHKHFHREMIVAVGKSDDDISDETKAYILDKYMRSFQERNPNLKVFSATMHLDERQPHLHIDFVPIAHKNRGQKVVQSMNKAMKQQFEELGYEPPENLSKKGYFFNAWQQNERREIERLMNEHQLELVRPGAHKTMSIPTFKKTADEAKIHAQEEAEKVYESELEKHEIKLEDTEKELLEKRAEKEDLTSDVNDLTYEKNALEKEILQKIELLKEQNVVTISEVDDMKIVTKKKNKLQESLVKSDDAIVPVAEIDAKNNLILSLQNQLIEKQKEVDLANKNTEIEREMKLIYMQKDDVNAKEKKVFKRKNTELEKENLTLRNRFEKIFKNLSEKLVKRFKLSKKDVEETLESDISAYEQITKIESDNVVQHVHDESEEIEVDEVNFNRKYLKDVVILDCVYSLAPSPESYFETESWSNELEQLSQIKDIGDSANILNLESFIKNYDEDIQAMLKVAKIKGGKFNEDDDHDRAVTAYKMTVEQLKDQLDHNYFTIPDHPIKSITRESQQQKIINNYEMDWD